MYNNSHVSYVCLNFLSENELEEGKSPDDSIEKNKSALDPPRNRYKISDQNIDSLLNSLNFPICQKHLKATFQSSNINNY